MKNIYKYTKYLAAAAFGFVLSLLSGCVKDLDQYPHTDTTSKDVYTSVENYESVLSGIYTSMIVNLSSISSDDRYQNYTRCLTMFQECSTDTIDDVWLSGETMTDVSFQQWNAGDPWVSAMFYHIYNIVALANEFIRNSSEDAISGFSDADKAKIRGWRDEARGLRALAYYHELDFFNVASFVTENNEVGSYIPETYSRKQLFGYIESELKELGESLPSRNYGHFTKSTANALLARLYLNAEVYTGDAKWDECIAACNKVLDDGYMRASSTPTMTSEPRKSSSRSLAMRNTPWLGEREPISPARRDSTTTTTSLRNSEFRPTGTACGYVLSLWICSRTETGERCSAVATESCMPTLLTTSMRSRATPSTNTRTARKSSASTTT